MQTAIMSLMGFGLVLIWAKRGKHEIKHNTWKVWIRCVIMHIGSIFYLSEHRYCWSYSEKKPTPGRSLISYIHYIPLKFKSTLHHTTGSNTVFARVVLNQWCEIIDIYLFIYVLVTLSNCRYIKSKLVINKIPLHH